MNCFRKYLLQYPIQTLGLPQCKSTSCLVNVSMMVTFKKEVFDQWPFVVLRGTLSCIPRVLHTFTLLVEKYSNPQICTHEDFYASHACLLYPFLGWHLKSLRDKPNACVPNNQPIHDGQGWHVEVFSENILIFLFLILADGHERTASALLPSNTEARVALNCANMAVNVGGSKEADLFIKGPVPNR